MTGKSALLSCMAAGAAAAGAAPAAHSAALAFNTSDPGLAWGACPEIFPSGCEIAVLHGDPTQANADVFLRLLGGVALPAHRHTSAERMVLVSGALRVRYDGTSATTLAPGSYAYGPPNVSHEAACVSEEPCVLFIAFEDPIDASLSDGHIE